MIQKNNNRNGIFKQLYHENVIKVSNLFEKNDYFMIIMKYYEGGELLNDILNNERLNENETAFFINL